jgi:hypothetical protein
MLARSEYWDESASVRRITYASPAAVREHFNGDIGLRSILKAYCGIGTHSESWMPAGFSAEMALEACTMGLQDNVEAIQREKARAERLDVQVRFPSWSPDIAGAFPDVPSAIAGDPLSMRRLVDAPNDLRPIRIFVGMASSSSFSSQNLAKRGALVSALALQLAKTRVVEIYAVNAGSYWVGMVRLPVPTSASDLSYWICHQGSVRGLLYAIEKRETGQLTWPIQLMGVRYDSPEGIAVQARLFGAKETDIVIPFPHASTAAQAEMFVNTEAWMRNTLARVNAGVM